MFAAFRERGTANTIYVNPTTVRLVWPVDAGSAEIIFDKEHKVTVAEPAQQVAVRLAKP